ncbi:MAG: outer membrane protein assembly factor BamE domain-containing protein [Rudaea sp.]
MLRRASGTARAVLLLALMLGASAPAHAGTSEEAALREQVDALRTIVAQLQAQVNRLAAIVAATPAPAAPQLPAPQAAAPAPPAAAVPAAVLQAGQVSPEEALKDRWSQIRSAMSQDDVTKLLGAPSRQFSIDGRRVWYYVYPGIGRGSVFFTGEHRVSSRQSPFGWGG